MTNKILKKKIAINIVVSLTIIFGVVFFAIAPSYAKIKEIKIKTEELRVELEKKFYQAQNLKKLSENLKEVEEQLPKLNKIFIKKSEALNFITTMEKMAVNSGVNQRINLGNLAEFKKDECQKIPLEISNSGNFSNQIKYLAKLESLDYYINIKSLEISRSGPITEVGEKGLSESNINLIISSNTYWIND